MSRKSKSPASSSVGDAAVRLKRAAQLRAQGRQVLRRLRRRRPRCARCGRATRPGGRRADAPRAPRCRRRRARRGSQRRAFGRAGRRPRRTCSARSVRARRSCARTSRKSARFRTVSPSQKNQRAAPNARSTNNSISRTFVPSQNSCGSSGRKSSRYRSARRSRPSPAASNRERTRARLGLKASCWAAIRDVEEQQQPGDRAGPRAPGLVASRPHLPQAVALGARDQEPVAQVRVAVEVGHRVRAELADERRERDEQQGGVPSLPHEPCPEVQVEADEDDAVGEAVVHASLGRVGPAQARELAVHAVEERRDDERERPGQVRKPAGRRRGGGRRGAPPPPPRARRGRASPAAGAAAGSPRSRAGGRRGGRTPPPPQDA